MINYEFTKRSEEILDCDECFFLIGEIVERIEENIEYQDLINRICEIANCTEDEANNAISEQMEYLDYLAERRNCSKPRCPTCNSTNIHKISGLSKAGSVAMWGIFSQKVKKQFHCDDCGYEW